MSDLIVVAFEGQHAAEEAILRVERMERDWKLDLHEAIVVSIDKTGHLRLRHVENLMAEQTVGGGLLRSFWGAVLGAAVMKPSVAAGAATCAIAGSLDGAMVQTIDGTVFLGTFRAKLAGYLKPDTSAIAIVRVSNRPRRFLFELHGLKGTVIESSLSASDEKELWRISLNNMAA